MVSKGLSLRKSVQLSRARQRELAASRGIDNAFAGAAIGRACAGSRWPGFSRDVLRERESAECRK